MERLEKFKELMTEICHFLGEDAEKRNSFCSMVLADYLAGEMKTISKCIEARSYDLALILLKSTIEQYEKWKVEIT